MRVLVAELDTLVCESGKGRMAVFCTPSLIFMQRINSVCS